jgi:hypothetical protein
MSLNPLKKKRGRKKKPQTEGIIQSGVLFIGDPIYMSGDMNQPGAEDDAAKDVTNPFKNFSTFLEKMEGHDSINMHLPDSYRDNPEGRGCAIQLNQHGGKFQVIKKYDKKTGKLKELKIKLYE